MKAAMRQIRRGKMCQCSASSVEKYFNYKDSQMRSYLVETQCARYRYKDASGNILVILNKSFATNRSGRQNTVMFPFKEALPCNKIQLKVFDAY